MESGTWRAHRGQRTNISHSETVGREGRTRFLGAKFSIRLFRYYIKFLNKENMHTYSYGVLLYSDGRMPPLVALFADLYQFCTRYVKSNNGLCSADVLTIARRNTRQVNTLVPAQQFVTLRNWPPFLTDCPISTQTHVPSAEICRLATAP